MPRLKEILFPVDFSPPCARATGAVKAVAAQFDAGVRLLHATGVPRIPEVMLSGKLCEKLRKEMHDAAGKEMLRFTARHFPSIVHNQIIQAGDAAQVIVDYARAHKIDLVMMPTHSFGPLRRFLTGSVTAKVLHDVRCPVWTSAHNKRARVGADYRNILCAVDCSSDAVALMRWARWFGRRYQATVKLVHVIPALNETSRNRGEIKLRRYFLQRAGSEFEILMDQAGVRCELLIRGGGIAARLADTVREQHSNLLIVGRGHTQKSLGRLRTHSLAIIRESPCPVISV